MANKKLSIDEIERLVENAISEERGVTVESVEPNSDGDYCTVILEGDVLEREEVVGSDGRKYKIETPDDLLVIGSSICVRATCIETGRNDAYDLEFFV